MRYDYILQELYTGCLWEFIKDRQISSEKKVQPYSQIILNKFVSRGHVTAVVCNKDDDRNPRVARMLRKDKEMSREVLQFL